MEDLEFQYKGKTLKIPLYDRYIEEECYVSGFNIPSILECANNISQANNIPLEDIQIEAKDSRGDLEVILKYRVGISEKQIENKKRLAIYYYEKELERARNLLKEAGEA